MPPKSRKTGTQTSAFGSPGRVSHDSRAFYGKKLYAGLPQEVEAPYLEKELPDAAKNTIFCRSAENMAELRVVKAAMNLVTAMRPLPMRAAIMTFLDDDAISSDSF